MKLARIALAILLGVTTISVAHSAPADDKVKAAIAAFQNQDYAHAASLFRQVVASDKGNALAWHFLGQALAKTGDNMGARRAYAQVLKLAPDSEVANRTLKFLSELPEPDLFAIQLDSGMTLGDWMPEAQQQVEDGKREAVLKETNHYLQQLGPVPQLLAFKEALIKDSQEDQERLTQSAVSEIKFSNADSAKNALPKIRALRKQDRNSLKLIQLEAHACHLARDFVCAEKSYGEWLKIASSDDSRRKSIVKGMLRAKQGEGLPVIDIKMVAIPGEKYEIGKYEVTQLQWRTVMGNNPSHFDSCGDDCPVEMVSWKDIQEFLLKLNELTNGDYRLPTDAEWEKACFAGNQYKYCGSNEADAVAWYHDNSDQSTHQVGQRQSNSYGIYDMSGNVSEIVQDKWDGADNWRVLRGGAWITTGIFDLMGAEKTSAIEDFMSSAKGFRLARTLP